MELRFVEDQRQEKGMSALSEPEEEAEVLSEVDKLDDTFVEVIC
jgi:hypothetical protein